MISDESDMTADAQLARNLQKMWPHRTHESGIWRTLLCWLGMHLWLEPNYTALAPKRAVRFCLWCERVEIDGRQYC